MTPNEELALQVARQEAKRLAGQLYTAIESFGLPDEQAAACKRVVHDRVYDAAGKVEAALRGRYPGTGERL
jgi:hypothetical protein